MILAPARALAGIDVYEPGEFLSGLQAYDPTLQAYRDYSCGGKIVVFSTRKGTKTYEFSAKRGLGELWPELERKIVKNLGKMDVWKRYGSGEKFDDAIAEEAESETKKRLASAKSDRIDRLKEELDRAGHVLKTKPRLNVPIKL